MLLTQRLSYAQVIPAHAELFRRGYLQKVNPFYMAVVVQLARKPRGNRCCPSSILEQRQLRTIVTQEV
jgi:hypothetical protein